MYGYDIVLGRNRGATHLNRGATHLNRGEMDLNRGEMDLNRGAMVFDSQGCEPLEIVPG